MHKFVHEGQIKGCYTKNGRVIVFTNILNLFSFLYFLCSVSFLLNFCNFVVCVFLIIYYFYSFFEMAISFLVLAILVHQVKLNENEKYILIKLKKYKFLCI